MASVNKVILVGNLGRDPEMRYMPSGDALCSFSVACTESWKDKQGVKQEKTEWVRISLFGKLAEIAGEYLKKGSSVYLEGRLQTREWADKEGNKRQTTEVVCDRMQMLGGKPNKEASDEVEDDDVTRAISPDVIDRVRKGMAKTPASTGFDDFEDDIPF